VLVARVRERERAAGREVRVRRTHGFTPRRRRGGGRRAGTAPSGP
jgi:hypothetical protein